MPSVLTWGFFALSVELDNADYGAALCAVRGLAVHFCVGKVTRLHGRPSFVAWRLPQEVPQ